MTAPTEESTTLTAFERAVVAAVAGTTPLAEVLRAHAAHATVVRRERDDAAHTTYVCVPADSTVIAPGELVLGERVEVDGRAAYAEVVVHHGWLDSLVVMEERTA